jgi:tetratricopeptide (TPR) repeat protein
MFIITANSLYSAPSNPPVAWIQLVTASHTAALAAHQSNPSDTTLAWKLARACFDLAEVATNDDQRRSIAEQGIQISREALTTNPASASTLYYLGMNLGQLARTKSLGALKIVKEMEVVFEKARVLDESFDYAGPDRCLGMLYLEAPGWPTSIGNKKKALTHFRRSVEVAPDYPENRLLLTKTLLLTHDWTAAESEWAATRKSWTQLEPNFTGPQWEAPLLEWKSMRTFIEQKLENHRRTLAK